MSKAPWPIRKALRDSTPDPARTRELWSQVSERLQPRRRLKLLFAAPVLAACAVVVLILWARLPGRVSGALLLADGGAIGLLQSPPAAQRVVLLDDHSRILLDPATVLEPLVNDEQRFEVAVRRGRARFELAPGHPRKWTVDCGATIEVMAARFAAWKGDSSAGVEVFEGVVIVRGEQGAVQRLGPNQRWMRTLSVAEAPSLPPVAQTPSLPPAAATPPASGAAVATLAPRRRSAEPWRPLASAHKYREAYQALGKEGLSDAAARASSIEELLRLADVARLSAHPSEAVLVLDRALKEFPTDPRAALAAFTRGRVQADDLQAPAPAAESFARAIEIGLPDVLVEDAFMRLVEARLDGGDREAAQAAMRRYLERFPQGHFAGRMKKRIESH